LGIPANDYYGSERYNNMAKKLSFTRNLAIHTRRMFLPLCVTPSLILLAVAYAWPFAKQLQNSLFVPDFSLEYYQAVFTKPAVAIYTSTTLSISTWAVIWSVLLGYPVAYLLNNLKPKQANLLRILVLLPFYTSFLIRTYAWTLLLGRRGIINGLLVGSGLISDPLRLLYTRPAVLLGMVQVTLPLVILPLYAVMRGIDKDMISAARNLGASPFKAFSLIFLPLSLPGVASGSILVFVTSMGAYLTAKFLGGPNDQMLANLIESQIMRAMNWEIAAAETMVLLTMSLTALIILQRVLKVNLVVGWSK